MKLFVLGLSAGYLLTSLFSIPSPPLGFWLFTGLMAMFVGTGGLWWYRFNDDLHEGEF